MCLNTYDDVMAKKTTTLTLDEDTVEKAKKMGINISELTETVLKGFTFEPEEVDQDISDKKYRELFKAIVPILKKQNTSVEVGAVWQEVVTKNSEGKEFKEYVPAFDVSLLADGTFYIGDIEVNVEDILNDEDFVPSNPKKILSNLIKAIDERKEQKKDEIKEIELVKRIIEALYPSFAKKQVEVNK